MKEIKLYLIEETYEYLQILSTRLNKSVSETVESIIHKYLDISKKTEQKEILEKAEGLWEKRDDIQIAPDFVQRSL